MCAQMTGVFFARTMYYRHTVSHLRWTNGDYPHLLQQDMLSPKTPVTRFHRRHRMLSSTQCLLTPISCLLSPAVQVK